MTKPLPKHRAREYETVFIVSPDTTANAMDQVANRLTDVVTRLDGKILRAENWGRRRLAYPVKKHDKGTYIYLKYLGYTDMVHELERNMRMIEPVLKYLTVKLNEDVNPESITVREEDISFAPLTEDDYPPPAKAAPVADDSTAATAPADADGASKTPADSVETPDGSSAETDSPAEAKADATSDSAAADKDETPIAEAPPAVPTTDEVAAKPAETEKAEPTETTEDKAAADEPDADKAE